MLLFSSSSSLQRGEHQSSQADKQNQVLFTLTFVTIVIAPLQLLTGVYGMNFAIIPELEWEYGYIYFWSLSIFLMTVVACTFYAKGWLASD